MLNSFTLVNLMRTIEWDTLRNELRLIDQRKLPGELVIVSLSDYHQVAKAIREMVVRGAPAIGVTGAFGMALAAHYSVTSNKKEMKAELEEAAKELQGARPTAVNLRWGLNRMLEVAELWEGTVTELSTALLNTAQKIADEDVAINKRMAVHGASLIDDGDIILHHCNTGALAAVDWGTALGVIRMAHDQGKTIHVLVDETRPMLQGSRLTAWELQQYKISFDIIPDGAAGFFLKSGQVKKVFFGGDRVAANGDVANKIGTYMLALAAYDNSVPNCAVIPTSTIDLSIDHGGLIPIEERDPEEVLQIQIDGKYVAPIGASARNPAFDITHHRLISVIVTENGLVYPPFRENLFKAVWGNLK